MTSPVRHHDTARVDSSSIAMITADVVVAGAGAAGLAAADRLHRAGVDDVLVICDKRGAGTSRNAGSDKQTYYKLTLSGADPDSVEQMAQTLYAGGAMDGDNALVEAATSTRSFMNLLEAGVPFPQNQFGEFVGYQTDHDTRERATSVGPFTSRAMVEALEHAVASDGIEVLDGLRLIDIITGPDDGQGEEDAGPGRQADWAGIGRPGRRVLGLLCLRIHQTFDRGDPGRSFLLIRTPRLVLATGGPASIYADSVYPHGQWGAQGAAFRAGAPGRNLTEWQFGLASLAPRWNVSGSYLQVMPTLISTDADGADVREFLTEYLTDDGEALSLVFLKGYQWPFDIRKAAGGSSLIDLLVYRERVQRGRHVYLDFRRNAGGRPFDPSALRPAAREYLQRAGADGATPIERLIQLNRPAYEFFVGRGVDLAVRPLEIAVCAQHNNGGLATDLWWRSPLSGLFPIGEAAATHGVYRPGGAALNAGQAGALRAAEYIAAAGPLPPAPMRDFVSAASGAVAGALELLTSALGSDRPDSTKDRMAAAAARMTQAAGVIRDADQIRDLHEATARELSELGRSLSASPASRQSIDRVFLLRDLLWAQRMYLAAMADYIDHGGASRGSALLSDQGGTLPFPGLPDSFRYRLDDGRLDGEIQELALGRDGQIASRWRPTHPIPDRSEPFETVWRAYREQNR